jgi:hypothetical protein
MTVEGADRLKRRLQSLPGRVKLRQAAAVARNGEDLISVARVLVPVVEGDARAEIRGGMQGEGYLADFGSHAKVIEGDSGPRPFVNPALSYTRKRRSGRHRRALKQAMKDVFNGN